MRSAGQMLEARRVAQLDSTLDELTAGTPVTNADASYAHVRTEYARADA